MFLNVLVLHPSHKTQYFVRQNWLQEWIDEATEIVRDKWRFFKAHFWKETGTSATHPSAPSLTKVTLDLYRCHGLYSYHILQRKHFAWEDGDDSDDEDQPTESSTTTAADPLKLYLLSPPLHGIKDPLMWWTAQNPENNPLAQFALDFLSVPGMLVSQLHIVLFTHFMFYCSYIGELRAFVLLW